MVNLESFSIKFYEPLQILLKNLVHQSIKYLLNIARGMSMVFNTKYPWIRCLIKRI